MALYKSNKYKGLYEVEQVEEILKIMKIHGTGPKGKRDIKGTLSPMVRIPLGAIIF